MTNQIKREDIPTGLSYQALITAFEQEMGRHDPLITTGLIERHSPWEQVEEAYNQMAGPHGLMIFYNMNHGAIVSLHNEKVQCSLYIVGNPLIADRILHIDVRASLFVPFRVCIYDNGIPNNAIISFDRPSSFLGALQNPALDEIGNLLDSRIDSVVQAVKNKYK